MATTLNFAAIVEDAAGTQMLTPEEVEQIARKVNERINLPFVGEEKELVIFAKIVSKVDAILYTILPNEIYSLIRSLSDGISSEEAETLMDRCASAVNAAFNLPWLSEALEQKIFKAILEIIVWALRKGWDLVKSLTR